MDYTKDIEVKQEIARVTDLGNKLMSYREALINRLINLEAVKSEEITRLTNLSTAMKASAEIVKQSDVIAEK